MKNVNVVSALIYLSLSALLAAAFVLATISGDYTSVDRFGGAAWVFLLSNIILMPVVIPAVKKRLQPEARAESCEMAESEHKSTRTCPTKQE